jgi:hypothetical protein
MTTDHGTQAQPLTSPKLDQQRPPLRAEVVQELEKFSVEVLQTVLALLQASEQDLEKGT